jgi:hypothetical protein
LNDSFFLANGGKLFANDLDSPELKRGGFENLFFSDKLLAINGFTK